MTLKEHIDDIRKGLEAGQYGNEAAVSQGIVLRLLGALAWPTFNTQVIIPEYSVEGRRVDYALCHPPSKPIVFIEVKKVGNIERAERQLFEYAFHEGVPIAVLTDGREWQFFHPTAQGDYRERKVYELNLNESNSEEIDKCLNRYLNYESMCTGEAVEAIKKDYEKVVQQRQVETRLPEVWDELVQKKNEDLLLIVMDAAKNKIGYGPTEEQVLDFLKSLKRETRSERRVTPSTLMQQDPASGVSTKGQTTWRHSRQHRVKASSPRFIVTMPDGEAIERPIKLDTFVEVLLKLIEMLGEAQVIGADEEGSCISTAPLRPGVQGRRYGNYFISTNHGTEAKKGLLDRIASRLGIQLRVEIVDKS